MIQLLLVFIPIFSAVAVWRIKNRQNRMRMLLALTSLMHLVLSAVMTFRSEWNADFSWLQHWLYADELGKCFLFLTSLLFCMVAIHTVFWIKAEQDAQETREHPEGLLKLHIFVSGLLAFEGMMTLVILSVDFGLLWVAVEATTLVSAPLILFHRSARSLEAMWKYLLICSVGIGLALFGTMLLAAAMPPGEGDLRFTHVTGVRHLLKPVWFKASFIFILAGYGTKMGLAPFHTWLPDAHSESPGTVSALLSGALLNCSLLGIIRFYEAAPDEMKSFCANLMVALGILSLVFAAFFTVRQLDFKRLLAYSSVEHMGLLSILWSIPSIRDAAAIHMYAHSLIKMALFLTAGNLLLACGTRRTDLLGGLSGKLQRNSILFFAGVLMICGVPPSPIFATELRLIMALPPIAGAAVLILLLIIFAAMTHTVLHLICGPDKKVLPDESLSIQAEKLVWIPGVMLVLALALGMIQLHSIL